MNNNYINQQIKKALINDNRLWTKESKRTFDESKLIDLVNKIDPTIIKCLIDVEDLRDKFFVKINDVYVFKMNDFRFFIEENSVENSYTQYANRIGLASDKRFTKECDEVVLDFPFKDCVLEGGQSDDEGNDKYYEYDETVNKTQEKKGWKACQYNLKTSKRREVFLNEVLAKNEIDRLFDPKALINWKRYTKNGEQPVGEIKRDITGVIKENLIIKGNNLLALHSIEREFSGKVKLIYIDPPYNTGNDSFQYNDKFNHSTWLTFMKNRLEIAHKLLSEDGAIIVQCDDNEQAYLKVLMDEMFIFKENISVKTSTPSGVNAVNVKRGEQLFKLKEYLLFYAKSEKYRFNPMYIKADFNDNYRYEVIPTDEGYDVVDLKKKFEPEELESYCLRKPEHIYSLEKNNKKAGRKIKEVIERTVGNDEVLTFKNSHGYDVLIYQGGVFVPLKDRVVSEGGNNYYGVLISDYWDDEIFQSSSSEGGVPFSNGKKPEKLLKRILDLTTKKGDLVLDYHLGSGSTAAVAHKMGRQYIGIEQMDYIEEVAVERLKKVIKGEQSGISKDVKWKEGGGDFIYFELAKWNEVAKAKITNAGSLDELVHFFDVLYKQYFLNYNVKVKDFKEKIINEEEFKALSLDEQKSMFITMLDINQMYVCATEMADTRYGINLDDQQMTTNFYNN